MRPTITSAVTISHQHLSLNNKPRKPIVEKMRRDRINRSIEQLKALLDPEFLKQQSDSKLEKADILEMTVRLMTHQQQKQQSVLDSSSHAVNQGFSTCVHEIVHFLSKDDIQKTQSQRRLLKHFQNLQTPSEQIRGESVLHQLNSTDQNTFSKEMNDNKSAIWRPW